LAETRRPLIVFLALIALVFGQSAAELHALKHLGVRNDASGAPAPHAQLCLECASFAPLAGAHSGPAHALIVAFLVTAFVLPAVEATRPAARTPSAFEARAPPR
jgi:hypothetical protein